LVRQEARKDRRASLHKIGKRVEPQASASSVRRSLHEFGGSLTTCTGHNFLEAEAEESKGEWAKDHQDWKMVDFERVIYSDECYVTLSDT
jgi:hypothetical protein